MYFVSAVGCRIQLPSSEYVLFDLQVEEVASELLLQVGGVWDIELHAELKSQHMGT